MYHNGSYKVFEIKHERTVLANFMGEHVHALDNITQFCFPC